MKIILDQIEFMLPEATYRLVSSSHALGRVKKANEVSKNIWNYNIKFEDSFIECEIKYGRNQVNKIQCACGRSNTKHPCLHAWIAAYWHYKEVVLPKSSSNTKADNFKLTKFDFSEYSQEELIQFIKLILKIDSKLNRWTELFLVKAYHNEDLFNFCLRVFNKFESTDTINKASNKLKLYKEQVQLLEYLYEQCIQDYIQGDIKSAFYKCLANLIKTDQWLSLYQSNNHLKLLRLYENQHKALEQILKGIKAAELYEVFLEFTIKILNENKYLIRNKTENIYSVLLNTANTKAQSKIINELIVSKIQSKEIFEANELETILFIINTLDIKVFKNLLKNELAANVSTQSWLMMIEYLKENQFIETFEEHLSLINQFVNNKDVKIKAAESIITHQLMSNQIEKCIQNAKKYAIQLSHLNFAKLYFSKLENNPSNIMEFINEYKSANSILDQYFILDIFTYVDEKEFLVNEIELSNSLEITMNYDSSLFKNHWNRLLAIYYKLSEQFLNNHAGTQAFLYIDKIRKHILKYGKKSMVDEFSNEVQKLFPERSKLLNINS
ncbi:MAG: hypothetical protein ABI851_08440 [Saprospiraceae bacterium]